MNEQQARAIANLICRVIDYYKNSGGENDRKMEAEIAHALNQIEDAK